MSAEALAAYNEAVCMEINSHGMLLQHMFTFWAQANENILNEVRVPCPNCGTD
jgi:hypothetical protein